MDSRRALEYYWIWILDGNIVFDGTEKAELTVHQRTVSSLYDLLGKNENALTAAVGWMLHESPAFLDAVLTEIFSHRLPKQESRIVRLQSYEGDHGYTDIEIDLPGTACAVIEAKKGWQLPSEDQLSKYALRKAFQSAPNRRLVVLNECLPDYVDAHLHIAPALRRMLKPMRWQWLISRAEKTASRCGNREKGLLRQMTGWLRGHVTMRAIDSNWVYVVSIGSGTPRGWKVSWIDIVEKKRRYFHSIGINGWPAEPPNYMGFRYHGKLQSIHFVESFEVIHHNLHEALAEIPVSEKLDTPAFLYNLGPPIRPTHAVTGKGLYPNGRCWCMLDTLLTCKSIVQARNLSHNREKRVEL